MSQLYSRRTVLGKSVVLTATYGIAQSTLGQTFLDEALASATPGQILGPVYPVEKPRDRDADLTARSGQSGHAEGRVCHFSCRIVDLEGNPVSGAEVELWQANTHGRYTHPADVNPAPIDPNFDGYAALRSDRGGAFTFKTIKPGAYPANEDTNRPPHIHFDILGQRTRLITQLYFPGEPLNEMDDAFMSVAEAQRPALVARPLPLESGMRADALHFGWEIRLASG